MLLQLMQIVAKIVDYKWLALNVAVVQRLKKLMAGVADPESVWHEHEARQGHRFKSLHSSNFGQPDLL